MLYVVGALLVGTALAAPPPVERDVTASFGGGKADKFEVLDVSIAKGYAALKIVAHHEPTGDGGEGSVDCKYAGMSAWPRSGVTLALWDLQQAKIAESWVVYAVADSPGECSPAATNEANLAAAKAKFLAVGLDIARKPAAVAVRTGSTVTVAGKSVQVATADGPNSDDRMVGSTFFDLALGGTRFYRGTASWTRVMGGSCSGGFEGVYVEGTKAVFLGHFAAGNGMAGWSDTYFFTPVVDLAG